MHKGKRISIPVVEESSHGWHKFAKMDSLELQGRPTKVLKRFVDVGVEKKWWDGKALRESKAFKSLVVLVWGKEFWERLERMRERGERENIR